MYRVDLGVLDDLLSNKGRRAKRERVHLLLLNWQLLPSTSLLKLLRAAESITCVDGGAIRLMERIWQFDLPTISDVIYYQGTCKRKPLYIVGDGDSIDNQVGLEQLQELGFKMMKIEDNNTTDFFKALDFIEGNGTLKEGDTVIVDGAFGGRFDQVMASFAVLYKRSTKGPVSNGFLMDVSKAGLLQSNSTPEEYGLRVEYNTVLIGEESVCCLLPPTETSIKVAKRVCTRVCGLIPLGMNIRRDSATTVLSSTVPVDRVTTSGLRWNLEKSPMSMDGLVSTSNEVGEVQTKHYPHVGFQVLNDEVHVASSKPIMWYSQLEPFCL